MAGCAKEKEEKTTTAHHSRFSCLISAKAGTENENENEKQDSERALHGKSFNDLHVHSYFLFFFPFVSHFLGTRRCGVLCAGNSCGVDCRHWAMIFIRNRTEVSAHRKGVLPKIIISQKKIRTNYS